MAAALPGDRRDAHRRGGMLVDVILGGQDGLVNVLGFVLGTAAATGSVRATGLAGALAGCIAGWALQVR